MKKKWIILYLTVLFLPYLSILILGKAGYFEKKPSEPEGYTVALYVHERGAVEKLPLRDYLWGVLAGEMPASYPEEALKAQAVASYTYLLHRKKTIESHPEADFGHPGEVCNDPAHCKAFLSPEEAADRWGRDWLDASQKKLSAAVEGVLGQAVLYNGTPANTVFHAISGGRTESAEDVWGAPIPYLTPVESPWDAKAPGYASTLTLTQEEFLARLELREASSGAVVLSEGGSVATMVLGGQAFTGRELRERFGLRSTRFTLTIDDEITFRVQGYGHQVGMSQYGASVLAENGYTYREILRYYYPGTTLCENYFE